MVLISIHPFALRRLFLVVIAVAGFSALCFADPVLMAQRYGPEKPRTTAAKAPAVADVAPASAPFANFDSANLSSPIVADAAMTLDETRIPAPVVSWNWRYDGPVQAFYGTASHVPFHTANTTD